MSDTAEKLLQVLSEQLPFPHGDVCRPSPSLGVVADALSRVIQSLEEEFERVAPNPNPAPHSDLVTSLLAISTRSLTTGHKTGTPSTPDMMIQLWKLLGGDIGWSVYTWVRMRFLTRLRLLTRFL